ncbi:MAG TPA: alpha-E domain-containing protein [Flavitalea sp.]|nr:alpha-E domain-containing protein [Flavitalea sp.]
MLSRVADSLYWMSRYMERSDGIIRMLRVNYAFSQEDFKGFSWKPVLKMFTVLDDAPINSLTRNSRAVLQYLVSNRENRNSIINIITRARENARSGQDHITKELWQCLNEFYHSIKEEQLNSALLKEDPITILDGLTRQCVSYYGTADMTMIRGEGYSFINIGKFLERAVQVADILGVKFVDENEGISEDAGAEYWKHLLNSISGYELYLKTYRGGLEARNVIEQVILNGNFPRSIIYSINRLHRYFERLRSERNTDGYNKLNFMIGELHSRVRYSTADSIMKQGLHAYLFRVKEDLYNIANSLNQHYFAYSL